MAKKSESPPGSTVWYQLGYALENTRSSARLRPLSERLSGRKDAARGERRPARTRPKDDEAEALEALVAAGAGSVVVRLLDAWPARSRPGVGALLRAGAAGAGAALIRRIADALLLDGETVLDEELAAAVAAGAARGLVYATVVEPRLRGAPLVRGALYGALEYAVSPWGGLTRILGREAPLGKMASGLFEDYDPADDTLVDHVAFAVALAVLYGGDES